MARQGLAAAALCLGGLAHIAGTAEAAVPPAQRQALVDLYNAANGPAWTANGNWLVGDPCDNGWFGIACGAGNTTVVRVDLPNNQLSGSLSALGALVDLENFDVLGNQLTGGIPPLSGLAVLGFFRVSSNQLSGPLPDFSNLPGLYQFDAAGNQLSGPIPPLAGLPGLRSFNVAVNQLTGPIPPLAGLAGLAYFNVSGNQLSGPLPALAGLADLQIFSAAGNQLTGSIPPLGGLVQLSYFSVAGNRLTGTAPDLAGLAALQSFYVNNNQLSGPVPTAPASLVAGASALCPNLFVRSRSSANDLAWNTATGQTPWSNACPLPVAIPTLHGAALALLTLVLAGVAALRLRGRP